MLTLTALGQLEPHDMPSTGLGVIIRADTVDDLRQIGRLFDAPVRVIHANRMLAIREAIDARDYDAARRLADI